MRINATFMLCATNELLKYFYTDVQLWRAKQEKQVWGKHLAEAVGVEPDLAVSRVLTKLQEGWRLRLEMLFYGMLRAEEMMAECGIWRDPGHESVTGSGSLHPSVAFKHQEQTWKILW